MTRYEFALMLARSLGYNVNTGREAADALAQAGITTQVGDAFGGNRVITRAEAATMFVRAEGGTVGSVDEGLEMAVDMGLFTTMGDGAAGFESGWFSDVWGRGDFSATTVASSPAADATVAGSAGDYGDYQEDYLEWVRGGRVGPAPREEDYYTPDPVRIDTGEPSSAPVPAPPTTPAAEPAPVDPTDVPPDYRAGEEILRAQLTRYGLTELIPWAFDMLRQEFAPSTIALMLRDAEAPPGSGRFPFRERFAGLELRREQGHVAISPDEYLSIERQMKQTAEAAGLPPGFYDDPSDFAEFIGNDVSPDEYTQRVAMAATAVRSVNPELRQQLIEMYGVGVGGDGDLIAYYLDPERAVSVLEQRLQLEAAGLSGATVRTLGGGLSVSTAEQLAGLNVQQREIGERLGGQAGLVNTRLLSDLNQVTSTELAAAEFGLDSEATRQVTMLRRRREEAGRRQFGTYLSTAGAVGLGAAE